MILLGPVTPNTIFVLTVSHKKFVSLIEIKNFQYKRHLVRGTDIKFFYLNSKIFADPKIFVYGTVLFIGDGNEDYLSSVPGRILYKNSQNSSHK